MIERALLILWGFWLLLILVAALRVFGFLIARRAQDRKWGDGSRDQKNVAVIVPVKGFDLQATPRFFDTLFAQDYRNYRVIVAFESWNDPVARWLREELELSTDSPVWNHPDKQSPLKSITLVCAGVSHQEGQKVWNQRAAFTHLSPIDQIIAFVDADISFKEDWLARLTAPINQQTHPLSTTYRWLVPKRPTLPNQVASVINASIATQGGSELTNVLWGGSMAIDRKVFDSLNVPALFTGSLNDDLRLSKAARKAGNRVAFVRSLILPTLIDFSWKSFFEFAKRQYTQVKFFSPILYRGVNLVLGLYAIGLLSIIGALIYGYFFAWVPIAASYIIDQFRSLARQQVYLSLFPENGIRRKLFSASWLEHMLTPFWMLLHWLILLSTWTQNRITWAGIRYGILGPDKTKILERPVVAEHLPVGVPGLALLTDLRDRKRGGYTQPIRPLTTPVPLGVVEPSESTAAVPPESVPIPVSTEEEVPTASETSEDVPAPALAHPGPSEHVDLLSHAAWRRIQDRSATRSGRKRHSKFPREVGGSPSMTRVLESNRFSVSPIAPARSVSPIEPPPPPQSAPPPPAYVPPSGGSLSSPLPLAARSTLLRPFRQRRSRVVGSVRKRISSSSRAGHVSRQSRGSRRRTVGATGPAARPRH